MKTNTENYNPYLFPGWHPRAVASSAGLLVVFVMLALMTHTLRLLHLDEQITHGIQHFRQPWLDKLAEGFTAIGTGVFLTFLTVCFAIGLYLTRHRVAAVYDILSLLGLPLNWLIKQMVDRSRPTPDLVQVVLHATGLSFPSGHSMGSIMVYGFLAFLLWTWTPPTRLRKAIAMILTALIVCIGFSRIYLGDHWFSDVFGGWIAGLFFLLFLTRGYQSVRTPLQPMP